ncbi:MAG: hypothetical protein ACREQ3_13825, partial [Candidatus Binatia bacterium]
LVLATSDFADPLVSSTVKAYRLLQTISSQLKEAQEALAPHRSAQTTTALAKAEEQVRIAFADCCRALYTAQLQAAKTALTRNDQQQALQHLLQADETLGKCAEHSPVSEPQDNPEGPTFKSALAQR